MSTPKMTETQILAGTIKVVAAVAECIRDLGQVPSGHLYARLMGSLKIEDYQAIINQLKNAELVKEENHLLTWVGPKKTSL